MLKRLYASPSTVLCIAAMVLSWGLVNFFSLPVALYPDTAKPLLVVSLYPSTQRLEDFKLAYGAEIEAKLLAVEGVVEVEGRYSKGKAQWEVSFAWGKAKGAAESEVRAALSGLESRFPRTWSGFGYHFENNNNARIFYSISSSRYDNEALWVLLQDRLKSRLERIGGVERAFIVKPRDEQIKIELNYDALLHLDIQPEQVYQALKAREYDHRLPKLKSRGGDRFPISVGLKESSLEDMANTVVGRHGVKTYVLRDVAKVQLVPVPPRSLFKGNGKRALIVGANIKPDANIAKACEDFAATIEQGAKAIDSQIQTQILVNPAEFINEAILNVGQAVALGILIATLVIFLFIGSLRLTLVIAIAIPLSLIGGFIVMSLTGIELNLISLGAMALAVGMVVDGSIVVMENIERHLSRNPPLNVSGRLVCIYGAVMEVRSAVVVSMLTTIIVFAPLSFTSPLSHAILGDLAKVIVCVLSISIIVTLFVVPPLMQLLKLGPTREARGIYRIPHGFQRVVKWIEVSYLATLKYILHRRLAGFAFAAASGGAMIGAYFLLSTQVTREILATPDTDKIWLVVRYPNQDLEIEEVDRKIAPIEAAIKADFAVLTKGFLSIVHEYGASILLSLKDKGDLKTVERRLEQSFVSTPSVHYHVSAWNPTSLEIPNPPFLELYVSGEDGAVKRQNLESMEEVLRTFPELGQIKSFPRLYSTNDYDIRFHQAKLNFLKQTPNFGTVERQIEQLIEFALQPKFVKEVFFSGARDPLPVELGFPEFFLESPGAIKNLFVRSGDSFLPLRHFLNVIPARQWGEYFTARGRDEFKLVAYTKASYKGSKEQLLSKIKEAITQQENLNSGLVSFADTQKEINENLASLAQALVLALGLIWIVVSLQFASLWQTFVVMGAIPLGFIGVAVSLYSFSSTLSINSMLGCILLCGTAVNNSILYVDFYNTMRKDKALTVVAALLAAARLRFRPILITTATTILGMLPIALGLGSGGEILQPLGIAVCGGLGISTFLTLLAVPLLLKFGEGFAGISQPDSKFLDRSKANAAALGILLLGLGLAASMEVSFAKTNISERPRHSQMAQLEQEVLARNPGLESQAIEFEVHRLERMEKWTSLTPRFGVESGLARASQLTEEGVHAMAWRRQTELWLSQDLKNPFEFRSELEAIHLKGQHLDEQFKIKRASLLYEVRSVYLSLLLLQDQLRNSNKNEELFLNIKKQNQQRYAAGFIHQIDVLKAGMHLDKVRLEKEQIQANLKSKQNYFETRFGVAMDPIVAQSISFRRAKALASLNLRDMKQLVVNKNSPQIRAARIERMQRENSVKRVSYSFAPRLSMRAGLGLEPEFDWSAARLQLSLSWSLYDKGSRVYTKYRNQTLLEGGKLAEREQVALWQASLADCLDQIALVQARLNKHADELDSWQHILTIDRSRYNQGLISYGELSEDLSSLLGQETIELRAAYDLALLLAKLAQLSDQPDIFWKFFAVN